MFTGGKTTAPGHSSSSRTEGHRPGSSNENWWRERCKQRVFSQWGSKGELFSVLVYQVHAVPFKLVCTIALLKAAVMSAKCHGEDIRLAIVASAG